MENLNVSIEEVSKISRKLKIEVPSSIVKEEYQRAFNEVKKGAQVKGFRKGKTPNDVVETQYKGDIIMKASESLINRTYMEVIKEKGITPISYPEISNVSEFNKDKSFTFEATIEVKPSVEAKNYEGIEITTIKTEPTNEEVDKIKTSFLDSKATMEEIKEDRTTKDKDWLNIDLQGIVDGKEREDLRAKGYICQIGDKRSLMEDLSSGLMGCKIGEEKEIKTTYPKDFHVEELKGKDITFKTKVNKILDKKLPKFSDELVKKEGFKSSEDFLSNIKNNLKTNKEQIKNNDIRTQIFEYLVKNHDFEVPKADFQRRLPEVQDRILRNMFGQSLAKLNEKQRSHALTKHEKEINELVTKEVKLSYILNAIADKENINVSNDEVKQELELTAKAMNTSVDELRKKYGDSGLNFAINSSLKERKTFDYLVSKAKIVEKDSRENN